MRLDQYVTQQSDITRNKAQAMIKAWAVLVNNQTITKTWFQLKINDIVEISETQESKYVARSAMKLKWFLEDCPQNMENKIALDIWSSTGWFCQILLEQNIWKIFAVDVWTSQLHEILKNNEKIISLENTDIRNLKFLPEQIDFITCDVSFIKLDLILDSIINFIWENTLCYLLFKPQFEVWQNHITRKWVVKDERYTIRELNNVLDICRAKWLQIIAVEKSKMKWESWNEEIFIQLKKK